MGDEDEVARREQEDRERRKRQADDAETAQYRSYTCKHGRLRSDCTICNPPQ